VDFCRGGKNFFVPSRKRVKSCGMEVKFAVAITVLMVELGPPLSSWSRSLSFDKASGEAGSLDASLPPAPSLLAFP